MNSDIPSVTLVLEARRRAGEIVRTRTPDAAVEELLALDGELAYPARGEVWDALARVGTAAAGTALLAIAGAVTDRTQQKRLRTHLHGLRSRGVPVEMPSGTKDGTFTPVPQLPPLRTWASCADGAGAYQLLAHLHKPGGGICALACFAVTRGARDFAVTPLDSHREIEGLLAHYEKEAEKGMPPLLPIEADAWMALAERGMREHREGGHEDPEDLPDWNRVLLTLASAVSPRAIPPEPAGERPADLHAACADLHRSKDYASWFFDRHDVGDPLVDRCRAFLDEKPGAARDAAWDALEAELLAAVDTPAMIEQWKRGLRHNARVHAAAGDPGTASLEAALADLMERVPFPEHPFVREGVRLTPDRLFPLEEKRPRNPDAPESRWEARGWAALDAYSGAERRRAAEYFLDLWMMDQPEGARDRDAALKRLWGRDGKEYLADSALGLEGLLPALVHYHLWDFRRTHRSKTLAETLLARIDEVPEEARVFWRGRMNAVTSLYQIVRVPGEGVLEVEDYLNDARLVVESSVTVRQSAEGVYPLAVGKVFPVGTTNWLSVVGPLLAAPMKLPIVESIAHQLGLYASRRPTVDQLRARPEIVWRALRAAEETMTAREQAMRRSLERKLAEHGAGASAAASADFASLPEEVRIDLRRHLFAMQERHYAAWPDMEIPALDYRTPRKAVKDPLHRRLVVDLIREMEATSRQDPSGVDLTKVFAKLRKELGIVE